MADLSSDVGCNAGEGGNDKSSGSLGGFEGNVADPKELVRTMGWRGDLVSESCFHSAGLPSKIEGVEGVRGGEGGRSKLSCFEFLRGGGESDVISVATATGITGNGRECIKVFIDADMDVCGDKGGGEGEKFKKLDSVSNDMIFSPIGVAGWECVLVMFT